MEPFVKRFVKASVAWLLLGVTFGLAMAMKPEWTVYKAIHVHMMLLGFVTMMINGVGYHVVPRLAGRALWSPRAAAWHWWLANVGLASMVAGFWYRANGAAPGTAVLSAGGSLAAAGIVVFVLEVWRTIESPARGQAEPQPVGLRRRAG